jgi:ADP-ribosyl-[dinitrogen reductase] hydrolase
MNYSHALGSLLGSAVGDAIGLPYEGLSPRRAAALLGPPTRHRLLFGRGMVSDDAEHACMAAVALARSGGDPDRFSRHLARQLRWWIASLPAGTGMATARAAIRLWMGMPPTRSGVWSAGNGPAMRAPILGAAVADLDLLRRLVVASSVLTHTDPRATEGALVVAAAARIASTVPSPTPSDLESALKAWRIPADQQFASLLDAAMTSVASAEPTAEFAARSGMQRGVSGFIVHTVPVSIHAWLSSPTDLRRVIMSCVACGGDADTTAAIAAGIAGSTVGPAGVPSDWLSSLWASPRHVAWMTAVAAAACSASSTRSPSPVPRLAWPLIPIRNLALLATVLAHGFRRLAPPY